MTGSEIPKIPENPFTEALTTDSYFTDIFQAYIWDQWHHIVEPFATMVPYMVGIGNHEQDHTEGGEKDPSHAPGNGFHPWWAGPFEFGHDSYGECGVPMYYRFHMPDNGNAVFW